MIQLLTVASLATLCAAGSPPSVLMVLTSHDKLGKTKEQTGWYLPEAAHPFEVFKNAGVKMTWASPSGDTAPVDEGSVKAYAKDPASTKFLKTKWFKNTQKLSDVDGKDFDAVFVVGGYGVMWDLVGNKDLGKIVADNVDAGGITSAVCHGPAALVDIKLKDGSSLVKGKDVACFSNDEEDQLKRAKIVPKTCEDAFKDAGAKYDSTKPWGVHVAVAGKLITGQNPASAKATAEAVVAALIEQGKLDKDAMPKEEKKLYDAGFSIPQFVPSTFAFTAGVALLVVGIAIGRRSVSTRNQPDSQGTELLQEVNGPVE